MATPAHPDRDWIGEQEQGLDEAGGLRKKHRDRGINPLLHGRKRGPTPEIPSLSVKVDRKGEAYEDVAKIEISKYFECLFFFRVTKMT